MISKKFAKQLEDFNEEEYQKLQEFKELYDFLNNVVSEDAEDGVESVKRKPLMKRYV
jgi:condensin complex subunit 3